MTITSRGPTKWWRVVLAAVVALAGGWLLGESGAAATVEQHLHDAWATAAPADDATARVAIVQITDEDYRTLFRARRPLDPAVLRSLVETIASYTPMAIGIDIDTSSPEWATTHAAALAGIPGAAWARDARESNGTLEAGTVLGARTVEAEAQEVAAGLGLIVAESDGVVRTYQRHFATSRGVEPSFTCAVIRACAARSNCRDLFPPHVHDGCSGDDTDGRFIGYRRAFGLRTPPPYYSAAEVLAARTLPETDQAEWRRVFSSRVVLVGGTFPASGDAAHATPLGLMPGVEVMAHILATEMRGGGPHPSRPTATAMLMILETFLILGVLRFSARAAILLGAGVVLALAAIASLINEGDLRRVPFFLLVLALVLLLQLAAHYLGRSQTMFVDAVDDWRDRRRRLPAPVTDPTTGDRP